MIDLFGLASVSAAAAAIVAAAAALLMVTESPKTPRSQRGQKYRSHDPETVTRYSDGDWADLEEQDL
jgi:hypothetical protein